MSEEEQKQHSAKTKNIKYKIIIPIAIIAILAIIVVVVLFCNSRNNPAETEQSNIDEKNIDINVSRETSKMEELCVEENIGKTLKLAGYVYYNMEDLNICADIKDYDKNYWTFGVEYDKKPEDLYNEAMAEIIGTLEYEQDRYYIKASKITRLDSFAKASTNKIERHEFVKNLTEEDKNYIRKYILDRLDIEINENFIEDRFEIIDNNIIYIYTYVDMQQWGGYNVVSYLTTFYYDILPTDMPENWKELEYSELSSYLILLDNRVAENEVSLPKATGVSESEINKAKQKMDKEIEEKISSIKKKSEYVTTSKDVKVAILNTYKKYQYNNNIIPTINRSSDFNSYSLRWNLGSGDWEGDSFIIGDCVYKIIGDKALAISYYRKYTKSDNYKDESYSEYAAIGTFIEINTEDLIFYNNYKIEDLIALGCVPEIKEENYFVTQVKKITSSDMEKIEGKDAEKFMLSVAEDLDKQVYEHFGIK